MIRRLPIRVRLTLAFAAAMAAVLAAMSLFLVLRLRASLDETIDEGLQRRAAAGAAAIGSGEGEVTQLLGPEGRVRVASPAGLRSPLLEREELARAARSPLGLVRDAVPGVEGRVRLRAAPVAAARAGGGRAILVVGASLEERDEAVSELVRELLVIAPVALLLASLGGYGLATAALRPVERMRTEAAAVSGPQPGRRLTVPPRRDEIARLGETLNEMLARLEASLERERGFVADASHELRTPLAALQAELELALRRPRTREELDAALASAADETDRLVRLTEDLLVLARADERGLPLRTAALSVRELLALVADAFRARAEAAGRPIQVEAPESLTVVGDLVRLEQALHNLVDNALRHGGGAVVLRAVDRELQVELHVLDSGPGIPPDFLPRMFERFTRVDEARSGGGAGLGLAIVDVIARAHGGSAHASSRSEGGTDVWLSLPVGAAEP